MTLRADVPIGLTLLSPQRPHVLAVAFSLILHVFVVATVGGIGLPNQRPRQKVPAEQTVFLALVPPPQQVPINKPSGAPAPRALQFPAIAPGPGVVSSRPLKQPASMAAPPPPSAEEWAFAARYTLRNSKGYRYSWGQQVRSMMGTAIEGPDQGVVRFRVEIAPDGHLARLETLWSTSAVAEQLARQAVASMPPLPPTPTGKALVFEKTIAFTPYASDGPPSYRDDCLPEPPTFRNPFAWDGQSPHMRTAPDKVNPLDPLAMEECLRQLPKDSVEAEMARDQRAMERWGWSR